MRFGRGFAPDPAGGAHDVSPDPLADPSPDSSPLSAFHAPILAHPRPSLVPLLCFSAGYGPALSTRRYRYDACSAGVQKNSAHTSCGCSKKYRGKFEINTHNRWNVVMATADHWMSTATDDYWLIQLGCTLQTKYCFILLAQLAELFI